MVAEIPKDIKTKDASILISYIEAFTDDLRYRLRHKELADLKTAQELAEKIEKKMQSSGKSNIVVKESILWLGFKRPSTY